MKSKSILTALGALGLMFGGSICSHATPLASYQADVLAEPSLVSYYEFGTGTGTLNDYGPGGNNLSGPFNGNPGGGPNTNYVNGIAGGPDQALGFDGSGADCPYVGWPGATTSSFFNFPSGSGTVELWVQAGWSATPGYNPCIFSDLWYSGVYSVFMNANKSSIQIASSLGSPTFNLPAAAGTGWHHLAVEFNSGNCTMIWDGQNLGTQPFALVATEPGTLTLGTTTFYGSTAVPWIGNLDEVAIYSAALPLLSIQTHYLAFAGNAPVITAQPVSGAGVLGEGFNLSVAVSGTSPQFQWYKNSVLLANQTNTALNVATSLVATNAGTYTCVITNTSGSVTSSPAVLTVSALPGTMAAYQSAVLAEPSLISYYTFDDRTARDDFGGNNGTLVGGANYGNSFDAPGSALSVNFGGYDNLGVVPAFDFASGSGTVELWVQASAAQLTAGNYGCIISDGDGGGRNYSVHLNPGAGYLLIGPNNYYAQLPAALDTNWHHLALIFDGGANTLAVIWDGQPLNWNDGYIGSHPFFTTYFGAPVTIGSWDGNTPWSGNLDEVAFYSATLPVSEIQAHFAAFQSHVLPVIGTQPVGGFYFIGETVSLTSVGNGVGTVEWLKNGAVVSGQTNGTLSIANAQTNDSGAYQVVYTDLAGSVTSVVAQVSVVAANPGKYDAQVLANPSLISYYKFDNGTAHDYVGSNNGVPTGTTVAYDASFGGVGNLALDLEGGWVELGAVPAFHFSSGVGSVELWVQALWTNGYAGYNLYNPAIVCDRDSAPGDTAQYENWGIFMEPDKQSCFLYTGTTFAPFTLPNPAGFGWHHMVLTFSTANAGTETVAWDGHVVFTKTGIALGGSPNAITHFGATASWGRGPFVGKLDDVAFYSTTLSASDIYTHYLAALAVPSPVVNVSHSGTSAVISWPAAAGDWVLDSTPSLSPVSWTPVQTNGSPATVPLNGSYNFFRLRSQ